jgi:hypothetical protein
MAAALLLIRLELSNIPNSGRWHFRAQQVTLRGQENFQVVSSEAAKEGHGNIHRLDSF